MKQLKEYYTKLINKQISYLIEEKDNLSNEISEIATYISDFEPIDLGRLEIGAINEKRRQMKVIYILIEDLEALKSRVETVGFEERW